jgi:hypothetical protein
MLIFNLLLLVLWGSYSPASAQNDLNRAQRLTAGTF